MSINYNEMKERKSIRVAIAGITASLYVVLGYTFQPISFLGIQFRLAELMVGMCIIFPYAGLIGNVLGVFLVNLSSPLGIMDWIIGPIMNVPALYCIILFRKKHIFIGVGAILYAIIVSLYVAFELWIILALPFLLMFLQVFCAEMILAIFSVFLFWQIKMRLDI